MKLIIFGATGGTGRQLMERALTQGHDVTAVARTPAKITLQHPQLKVARGDVMEAASIAPLLAGQAVVLSALGAAAGRKPVTIYSQGMTNIIAAMQQHGVKRLLCVTAGALRPGGEPDAPFIFERIIKPLFLQRIYTDMVRMESIIMQSDLDWTIVRPPQLLDTPATGQYRVAIDYSVPKGRKLSRADLADFMLKHLTDNQYRQKAVAIAY